MINIPGHEPPTMHEYEDSVVYISIQPTTTTTKTSTTVSNTYDTLPNWTTRLNNINSTTYIFVYKWICI